MSTKESTALKVTNGKRPAALATFDKEFFIYSIRNTERKIT